MKTRACFPWPSHRSDLASPASMTAALLLSLCVAPGLAAAQSRDRSGEEVVVTVCASCHARGENGAPRIGDQKAWANRASQGLTALTEHALKGIRNMPAHGGTPGVSDNEIERAIVYMVNRSGGHWIEPLRAAGSAGPRSSEQIVRMQCSTCHQAGTDGAPKIGDRAAWMPRLKVGLDALVASAVHGHGAMPARGGLSDLSDQDIRGAIVYMFNYGVALPPVAAAAPARAADPYHKVVAGTEIFLGMMSAASIRSAQGPGRVANAMHGGVPSGKGYYHLNISLADSQTHAPITDAEVKVRVADAGGMTVESKTLDLMAENNVVSYGNYFRMSSGTSYAITAQIRRAGSSTPIEAKFDFKVP